jgi:HEAT repeat protein
MHWSCLAGLLVITLAFNSNDPPASPEEQTLRAAGLQTDDHSLLDFFRKRAASGVTRDHVKTLVRQLGDKSFASRERASAELATLGQLAVEALIPALKDPDLEIARRAEACLRRLAENGSEAAVAIAAARLVARNKPPGAATVLLAYLSHSQDPLIGDAIRAALADLALRDGQPEPVLVAALHDNVPLRRAAAAEAFCRAGAAALKSDISKLLKDPEGVVRLRVALALAGSGEKEAVLVLIELLGDLPLEQAFLAEDALLRLADDRAPAVALQLGAKAQLKCRDAWAEWWRRHGAEADLSRLNQAQLGRILIAQWDNGQLGRVQELDGAGEVLWQVQRLPWPIDVQLLPGNRLLLTEFYENRVAERDLAGKLLWHKQLTENAIAAQRLPDGNTFIATRSRLLEVDRAGAEVYSYRLPHALLAAQKCRDGTFSCLTADGLYVRLDAAGKEVSRFSTEAQNYCGFDVLPGGRVLVPQEGKNQVVEFSAEGKPVWIAAVPRPVSAMRLSTGNVLVASRDTQRIIELDAAGRTVREFRSSGYPWRARLR